MKMQAGRLEVFSGPMYASKSERLIWHLKRELIAKRRVLLIKPQIDDRYAVDEVVSHSDCRMAARNVRHTDPEDILTLWHAEGCPSVVGVDEAQFFTGLPVVVERLIEQGVRVLVAGLDLDYLGRPFGPMPELLAMAEQVTKLEAICTVCGDAACRTLRISGGPDLIEIGGAQQYEARCRTHWKPG